MYELAEKTTITRVTVSTAAEELVPSEDTWRRITIIPPASPQMNFAIDEDGDAIADCRAYNWVPMGTYPIPSFKIKPGQKIWAIADTNGVAPITVICEYLKGPTGG